jgi:hypothetical protein
METDMVNIPKIVMVDIANSYQIPNLTGGGSSTVMKLHQDNCSIVNALYLWNKFYCIDSFMPVGSYTPPAYINTQLGQGTPGNRSSNASTTPPPDSSDKGKHNQFTLWTPALNHSSDKNKLTLGFDDFELLAADNNFINSSGDPLIVDSLGWYLEDSWADLSYRKNEVYVTNINIVITLPTGQ